MNHRVVCNNGGHSPIKAVVYAARYLPDRVVVSFRGLPVCVARRRVVMSPDYRQRKGQ